MKLPEGIEPLFDPLEAMQRLLTRFEERGVIIGGVAASLIGRPRYTEDVDAILLLSVRDIPRLLEAAKQEGMEPRIEDAANFAKKNRIVLLNHPASDTNIDISLGILPFEEEVVERSVVHELGGLRIRLPTPEDLIILKAVAHRPKDLQDIRDLTNKYPALDRQRIERWVRDFGETLDEPELWKEIETILNE